MGDGKFGKLQKNNKKGPCHEIVLYPGFIDAGTLVMILYYMVLQDVTTGENWVNGTKDFFMLFLKIAYESSIISKQKI